VLGLQSIPDGLATGLLAGVNPLSGLYAYLVGTVTGGVFASSEFMAVQATGAMAIVVADVPAVHHAGNSERALFTLSVLTGVFMLAAGLLRLGVALRFVSNSVMVGFINAVGVNIVLGQLANFTGYSAAGENRLTRALNTIAHPAELHWQTILVGVVTIVLIVALDRTRVGAMGLVLAVVATSAVVPLLGWSDVATLSDLTAVPNSLPRPVLPVLHLVPVLIVPAIALTFVGLVQGAVISASLPNPDGTVADASGDFIGQGAANVAAGLFRGMPVGGSLSASSLNKTAGARTRQSLIIAGVVMAIAIVALGGVIGRVAMPALAGLLMLVGFRTIKPDDVVSVWRTGTVQATVLVVTFGLTIVIPIQYAVLAGVGLSVLLHTVRQSTQLVVKRRLPGAGGFWVENDAPAKLPAGEVVVLQPYGSLFFAAAPTFETALPAVTEESCGSVVILRLRGRTDLGTTFLAVLSRYAASLAAVGSKLVIVSTNQRIEEQLRLPGVTDVVGSEDIYAGDERVGAALAEAYSDATAWVDAHRHEPRRPL
jgi:sulfate permease, SulP family